jgi:predicted nucleic acid-binding protein
VPTLIDTTALVALLDGRHPEHELTRHIFAYELDAADRLVITNYVALETVDVLRRRLGAEAVTTFLRALLPAFEVEWVRPADHELAIERLIGALSAADAELARRAQDVAGCERPRRAPGLAGAERPPSLVDCTTFVVARRLGAERCLAVDERFEREGL